MHFVIRCARCLRTWEDYVTRVGAFGLACPYCGHGISRVDYIGTKR